MSQIGQRASTGGSVTVTTLTGNNNSVHVPPTGGNINIIGAGGVLVTGDIPSSTLTITAPSGTNAWQVVVASQPMLSNNGYIANGAGTVQLSLPLTSVVGDILEVTGINNPTGWQITQATTQQIRFGSETTTIGTGGSLTSFAIGDSVRMVCTVDNTNWSVLSPQGNITIV